MSTTGSKTRAEMHSCGNNWITPWSFPSERCVDTERPHKECNWRCVFDSSEGVAESSKCKSPNLSAKSNGMTTENEFVSHFTSSCEAARSTRRNMNLQSRIGGDAAMSSCNAAEVAAAARVRNKDAATSLCRCRCRNSWR